MKRVILILSLISGFLAQQAEAQAYGWVDISGNIPPFPYDTTIINNGQDTIIAGLTDAFFINDNEGWITTDHPFNDTAAILHTTDGGTSFTVQTTPLSCNAIWMLNANDGYAGGQSGFIYKTTNGGTNWNFHSTIANTLTDIAFPPQPADTGYACGFDGAIYAITSSGSTMMTSGINGDLNSLTFPVSSHEGWVCGGGSVIRHYTGAAWVGDQGNITGSWNAIHFVDNQNGWVAGNSIKHATDGTHWTDQTNPDTIGRVMLDVFFLNLNEGWIVGNQGLILHTTNGGMSWAVEANGLTIDLLQGVQFTSSTTGYVVGNTNTLLKYTQTTGIQENESYSWINVYPNPSSGDFQIEFSSTKSTKAKIEILNVLGEIVFEKDIFMHTGSNSISLHDCRFEPGVYFCNVTMEGSKIVRKLIIR